MKKEKKNANQLVILNLIQDLRRLSWMLRNNVRGRFRIKYGMTSLLNNRAFMLIELLVVVLIIGILAAIALPQYQRAVWTSRFVQAKTMGNALAEAMQMYYMTQGNYSIDFNSLDIQLPGITSIRNNPSSSSSTGANTQANTSWGYCNIQERGEVSCTVNKEGLSFLRYTVFLPNSTAKTWRGKRYCFAMSNSLGRTPVETDLNYRICQSDTGSVTPSPSWVNDKGFLYKK